MNTLRQVVRAFELVVSDKYPEMAAPDPVRGASPSSGSKDKKSIHQEMVLMDRRVLALLKDAEKRGLVEVRKGMGPEAELARNFALSTRMMLSVIEIVLHRSAAFPEVAIFSKRMCGMPAIGKAPPPSTMISRPIGDHQSAVLLNHFSTIAEEQAKKRELEAASRPKPAKQSSSKESVSTVSSASHSSHSHQSQHQQTHGSFPAWTPPSVEPSVAGWAPSNGHRNGGPQNGQAYAPNVQQFDLASDCEYPAFCGPFISKLHASTLADFVLDALLLSLVSLPSHADVPSPDISIPGVPPAGLPDDSPPPAAVLASVQPARESCAPCG